MDKNVDELQDLFNSELMVNSIPISNSNLLNINNNHNILKDNKNYKEDIINEEPKESQESKISTISKMYDLNNKIFSDDDMSLNKSKKLINKQNDSNNNKDLENKNINSRNSFLLSLNINEIQLDENNNDIKKIIPSDIYNYIRYSGNQLINNTKEGLKKLFIYLSDSLNNQKKINGSDDYYYNNDLNSENLLKIYIYIINIINKNENRCDIINESLFIINLILPLLPTMYINNVCMQLIDKFYYKTAFDELDKNNYLLFKQILRLNQDTFFDKIFSLLKNEKNLKIKKFWKKFIFDLIEKNNKNCGINYYLENNENIINILNEYHKEDLADFCLNLFDYNDLNEVNSNKDANELLKCISENKILSSSNDEENILSFKEIILNKSKDNETLNLIIENIFNKNNSDKKIINIDEKKSSSEFGIKNNLNSGSYFMGSFGTFNANKNNNYFNKNENDIINSNRNIKINDNKNYEENNEKYKNNEIFEVMNNNIIYDDNNKEIDLLKEKNLKKDEEKNIEFDSNKDDNLYLYSDKEEDSIKESNNNNINKEDLLLGNEKKNSFDSVVNYKFSISNKDIMNLNNQKNEKKSINNNNKNYQSKRTSKISEYYDYFNKRNTLNNNLFSSFSSFSSIKRNSNDIRITNNDINDKNENKDIMDNNNFLNNINNYENKENVENNNIKQINTNINDNKIDLEINNNKKKDDIINNDNFLEIINNKNDINKISFGNNDMKKINNK